VSGVRTEPGRPADPKRPLHSEWGLSLYLEPQRGDERKTFLLDFGWTPEAINGNMELLKLDPSKIEALIMSHGHFDHWGGLLGFLERHRKDLPANLTMCVENKDERWRVGNRGDLRLGIIIAQPPGRLCSRAKDSAELLSRKRPPIRPVASRATQNPARLRPMKKAGIASLTMLGSKGSNLTEAFRLDPPAGHEGACVSVRTKLASASVAGAGKMGLRAAR
jgi:Metallo-beta-lactamase superfamily